METVGTVELVRKASTHCDECGRTIFGGENAILYRDTKGQLRIKCSDEDECKEERWQG